MERARRPAVLDIAALSLCLLGFVGLIVAVTRLKTGVGGVPRWAFVGLLAMACAPFYLALVRGPRLLYLIAPIVAIFFLYPIASPHGIAYTTDPIFGFRFTDDVLLSGYWQPGVGTALSQTYSYYPIGNVFVGYIILDMQVPAAQAYMWIEPAVRLLAVPAIVWSLGRRLFDERVAAVALLLYLGTASILFNVPVQQGFGIIFVGLSFLAIVLLMQASTASARGRLQLLIGLTAAAIIMTHHLSSYLFLLWFAALVFLLSRKRYRPATPPSHLGLMLGYFALLLGIYIAGFTSHIFLGHEQTFETIVADLVAPETLPTTPTVGRTFETYETLWLAGSVLAVLLLAFLTIRRERIMKRSAMVVANGLVAAIATIATLPFIVTPLSYVPLRISEYANLFLAPAAAATLLRWARSSGSEWPRRLRAILQRRRWAAPAAAALLAAVLVMGGNLAPLSMRQYFEPAQSRNTDSALFLGADGVRSADWAMGHFSIGRVWGDQLAIDVYSGFANMRVDYGSAKLFVNTTMNASAWNRLAIGDYVVVDRFMLTNRPNFLHEPLAPAPLDPAVVEKFANDTHFALVYQDGTYAVYYVMSKP